MKNHNSESKLLKYLQSILSNTIVKFCLSSFIVALITCFIEYGFFDSPDEAKSVSIFGFSIIVFMAILFIMLGFQTLNIALLNYRTKFREDFSLYATLTFCIFVFAGILSPFTRLTIWKIPELLHISIFGKGVYEVDIDYSDYLIFVLASALLFLLEGNFYSNWRGKKSNDQYQKEQKREINTFLSEGFLELQRLFLKSGQDDITPYIDKEQYIDLELTDRKFLAWEERAKELVRLSSSSYTFDLSKGWHDLANLWVGENVDTSQLVFLYPAQVYIVENQLRKIEKYVEQIELKNSKITSEVIIAFEDNEARINSCSSDKENVRFVTEQELLENLIDFMDYRKEITRRVTVETLPDVSDIGLTVDDVYVDSQVSFHENGEKSPNNLEEYLCEWLDEGGLKQISLLGDYGQGKSTAMLMLTYHQLCAHREYLPKRIPILIELRGLAPKSLTPLKLLGAWASQYRIDAQALLQLHYAGRLILIFEGFDEMAMVGNKAMRIAHFSRLWQFLHPKAKVIITGRPNFFLDEDEQQKALGIYRPQGNNYYSEVLKLEPFSLNQIEIALRKYESDVRYQICNLASENSRFRELVSRPSLLSIVADLWKKENLAEKIEALNSASIMKLFVDRSYRRQGVKEGDNRRFMALNSSERDYFMQGIAAFMAEGGDNNQITSEELNALIDILISVIPDSVSEQTVLLGEEKRFLRYRLTEPEDFEDVKTDIRACALLIDDPAAPNTFKFGHKSFMEYLFAWTVSEYLRSSNGSPASRAILAATNANLSTLLKLPVSIEFLAELLYMDQDSNQRRRIDAGQVVYPDRAEKSISYSLLKKLIGRNRDKDNSKVFSILLFPVFIITVFIGTQRTLTRYFDRLSSRKEVFDHIGQNDSVITQSNVRYKDIEQHDDLDGGRNSHLKTIRSNVLGVLIMPLFLFAFIMAFAFFFMPLFPLGYIFSIISLYIAQIRSNPSDLMTRLATSQKVLLAHEL
jgi:hypothetical protein